jgi:hypothetical protein
VDPVLGPVDLSSYSALSLKRKVWALTWHKTAEGMACMIQNGRRFAFSLTGAYVSNECPQFGRDVAIWDLVA